MKKFYKKNKKLVGIFFLLLAVSFFVFWEFVGRSELLHERVVVLKEDVHKGSLITADMLNVIKIDVSYHLENSINKQKDILGLEAKHYIPAKTQLVQEYFDSPEFVLDENEKIMKLPNEWIHSYPETLRRKDKIYLYAIKDNTKNSEDSEKFNNQNSIDKNDESEEKLYIFNTTVAYVKDNTNKEVESLDIDRLVGSSTISVIEVVITDKEFESLKNYAGNGYTFALLYK